MLFSTALRECGGRDGNLLPGESEYLRQLSLLADIFAQEDKRNCCLKHTTRANATDQKTTAGRAALTLSSRFQEPLQDQLSGSALSCKNRLLH